jgi:aldose 1-epimerase
MRGFNCLRWQIDGGDLLDVAPDWNTNPVPTRSGHPVLFPFPNRVAEGRFTWNGRSFKLPCNDSTQANAIHGFTPYRPWVVVDSQAGADFATITGEFWLQRDAPECRELWPGDIRLRLTYRLEADQLQVQTEVQNPGPEAVPWALGYHPYFRPPTETMSLADRWHLRTAATSEWVVVAGLPTGERVPLPAERDYSHGQLIGTTMLDHLFGDLQAAVAEDGLRTVAELTAPNGGRLEIRADPQFTELVLFTPVHRRGLAVEVYTAPTDAVHLAERGQALGWGVIPAGGSAQTQVAYRWHAGTVA